MKPYNRLHLESKQAYVRCLHNPIVTQSTKNIGLILNHPQVGYLCLVSSVFCEGLAVTYAMLFAWRFLAHSVCVGSCNRDWTMFKGLLF